MAENTQKKFVELMAELIPLANEIVKAKAEEDSGFVDTFSDMDTDFKILDEHNEKYAKILDAVMSDEKLASIIGVFDKAKDQKDTAAEVMEWAVAILGLAAKVGMKAAL